MPGGRVGCGEAAPRLPTTLNVAAPGWASELQVMALDLAGIMVSAGLAGAPTDADAGVPLFAVAVSRSGAILSSDSDRRIDFGRLRACSTGTNSFACFRPPRCP